MFLLIVLYARVENPPTTPSPPRIPPGPSASRLGRPGDPPVGPGGRGWAAVQGVPFGVAPYFRVARVIPTTPPASRLGDPPVDLRGCGCMDGWLWVGGCRRVAEYTLYIKKL